MSHVDDGELTAYADGAYPVDDPVALRISAHLSTCGNCRNRLEQNNELRGRAADILAFAAPYTVAAPPFESLTTQLAASPPRRRPIPLAWAATIILALGLGWFGRGLQQMPENAAMVAQDAAAPASEQPAVSTRVLPETEIAAAEELNESQQPVLQAAPSRTPSRGSGGAADFAQSAKSGSVAGGAVAEPQVVAEAAAPPPPPPAPTAARSALAANAVRSEALSAAEAERQGIEFARIPELPVTRVLVSDAGTFVEQTLPDGKIIRISEVLAPAAPPPASVPAPSAERRKTTRERAESDAVAAPSAASAARVGRSFQVTGDLPADSLRALSAKVR